MTSGRSPFYLFTVFPACLFSVLTLQRKDTKNVISSQSFGSKLHSKIVARKTFTCSLLCMSDN